MADWVDTTVTADDTADFIRLNSSGVLRNDDRADARKYVLDAAGHLVMPATSAIMDATDTVLFTPEESDDALEILVSLEDLDPHGAEADRWRIYHGAPRESRVARACIEAAKRHGLVFDGDAVAQPNPLAGDEPMICREMNRDRRDELRLLTRHHAHVDIPEPTLVGVHRAGLDVRASLGIVHVAFPERATNGDEAWRLIETMVDEAGKGTST